MSNPSIDSFLADLQKRCLPGIWSRGLTLARTKAVRLEKSTEAEIILRVKLPDRPVSQKVSLWPADEDAFCDCEDRAEPCVHVAAAVAALRNGLAISDAVSSAKGRVVRYRLVRAGEWLRLDRLVGEEPFRQSLIGLAGAIQSGRAPGPPIDATQDDFAIDQILAAEPPIGVGGRDESDGAPGRPTWIRLLPYLRALAESQPGGLLLDGAPVTIGKISPEFRVRVVPERGGLRVELSSSVEGAVERFRNGAAVFSADGAGSDATSDSVLHFFAESGLSSADRAALAPPGKWYGPNDLPRLVSEILPDLEKRVPVDRVSGGVPAANDEPPRIVLRMEPSEGEGLSVVATIEYPNPFAMKNRELEASLARRMETELRMTPGRRAILRGTAIAGFLKRIEADPTIEARGTGASHFRIESEIVPTLETGPEDFSLRFTTPSGKTADPEAVLEAWRRGDGVISLLEGGFAPLPADWLDRFAPAIERLYALRKFGAGKLPPYARPELFALSEETGISLAPGLRLLQEKLEERAGIPAFELPTDLRADLREYQKVGVDWLAFLAGSGMGALLADDMGLGKTLQAIAVIRGRALVVAPKSVIHAWRDQLARFRPGLRVAVYAGSARSLDATVDVTLVTYGILRTEAARFAGTEWDLAILDEAQIIKNPESQVARAAHALRAKARITLSGTPVENRLDDLWSQFEFLNPGLLGSRAEFARDFADPIANGNSAAGTRFRRRVRPFILRRLKSEVAPELPPRTEIVLESELSPEERSLYEAVLASTRKEVLSALGEAVKPFQVLELLLRLRQACCHPALLPGQNAATSSKLELLAESLENSLAQGHRALVFSQWTSFLDLIGERLARMGVRFSRLDGSTIDRETVVREFQDPAGPSVMLLSLKAGGVGITLTAADHVYLMDSWWNPAVEEQAADRAHRIGQENPVLVSRLIAEGTIEEKILALQAKKRALSESVLSGDVAGAGITAEDIRELLG